MDVDVKAELILNLDDLVNLLLDELLVLGSGDLALGELVALDADLLGLGEGADGGSGEVGQLEVLLLLSVSLRELGLALMHLGRDLGLAVLDSLVVCPLRRSACLYRLGVGLEGLADSSRAVGDGLGNNDDLGGLLHGKGEPVLDLGGELLLAVERVGGVEERAGGGDDDALLSELLDGSLNRLDGALEVGLPDVAAVDYTGGENLLGAELGNDRLKLLGVPHEVDVNGVEVLEAREYIQVVDDVTEVGGEDKLGQLVAGELLVRGLEGVLDLLGEIVDEHRLVDLHRLGTGRLELLEELDVYGKQLLEERDGVDGLVAVGLAESEERDGADEDGAGDDAGVLGLSELDDGLGVGRKLEGLAVLEGGLDVVVV